VRVVAGEPVIAWVEAWVPLELVRRKTHIHKPSAIRAGHHYRCHHVAVVLPADLCQAMGKYRLPYQSRAAITMACVRGLFAHHPLLVTLWCQFKVWSSLSRSLWRRHPHCHARPCIDPRPATT